MKNFIGFAFRLLLFTVLFQSAYAQAQVLVYNGTGSSPTDVVALQDILTSMGLQYQTANSYQMNTMSNATLQSYKLIVWPGGNSIAMGNSLTSNATLAVRKAIVEKGVSYIGFCAGAFMAERSSYLYNVFNLSPSWFGFYQQGMTDIVKTNFVNGTRRDLVYWDGPHLLGFGKTIAKYPNGLPAISAHTVGKGFVVLSGVHPEAPSDWRWGFATQDSDGVTADINFTQDLIRSALTKKILPHF